MKQFLLGLSISIACIAGCTVATIAQNSAVPSARAAPAGVQKWEYNCSQVPSLMHGKIEASLNEMGQEGWEFEFSGSSDCAKRPVP